ncbi:MAG: hypothetical protein ABIC04_02345 [Nanoarchaeota archaeon]
MKEYKPIESIDKFSEILFQGYMYDYISNETAINDITHSFTDIISNVMYAIGMYYIENQRHNIDKKLISYLISTKKEKLRSTNSKQLLLAFFELFSIYETIVICEKFCNLYNKSAFTKDLNIQLKTQTLFDKSIKNTTLRYFICPINDDREVIN